MSPVEIVISAVMVLGTAAGFILIATLAPSARADALAQQSERDRKAASEGAGLTFHTSTNASVSERNHA